MLFRKLRAGAPAFVLLCIGGCAYDPYERPGSWQPTGANERNLRAMVANPVHLNRGAEPTYERGDAGANAVTRLLTERRRPLPSQRSSTVGAAQAPQADQPLPGLGVSAGGGDGGAR